MRKSRSAFALLLLLGLGISLAVPAEDVPETAYDESEALPYECTPLFSIVAQQASDRTTKAELRSGPLFCCNSSTKRGQRPREDSTRSHGVPVSLTILNHFLRC